MTKEWEISAIQARMIASQAPFVKLNEAKKKIMQEIEIAATRGENNLLILLEYQELSCLEDWCNIYNWLKKLGYKIEDNSGNKFNPNFCIAWK